MKLVSRVKIEGVGECVTFNTSYYEPDINAFRSRLTMEYILIDIVKNWAVKMGFSSAGAIKVRNTGGKAPVFSTHAFDIVGPSYLTSLMKKNSERSTSGFFVADVIWQDDMEEAHIASFIRKIKTLSALKGLAKFQSMIVANGFSKQALMASRGAGIITVTPDTLLGRDVAQALVELLDVLSRAARVSIGNPERIQQLFDKLSTIEGLTSNLRGAMFELITANIVKSLHAGSIDIGEIVTDPETKSKADIDVRLVSETDVVCHECKGYSSDNEVTLDEVKYWLEKQVPTIRASQRYELRFSQLPKTFEFWTTGKFSLEAEEFLKKRKDSIKKYRIEWRDGNYVLAQAKKIKSKTILKVLKTHYFNKSVTSTLGLGEF